MNRFRFIGVASIMSLVLMSVSAFAVDVVVDGDLADWDSVDYVEGETGVGYVGGSFTKYSSTEGAVKYVFKGVVNPLTGQHTDATAYGYAVAGENGGMYFGVALLSDIRNRDTEGGVDSDAVCTMIPCLAMSFGLTSPDIDDVGWRISPMTQARLTQQDIGDDPNWTMEWYKYALSDDDPTTAPGSIDEEYSTAWTYDEDFNWVWFKPDEEMLEPNDGFGFPEGIVEAAAWDPIDHYRIIEYFIPWSAWQDAVAFSIESGHSLGEEEGPDFSDLSGADVTFFFWHQRANDSGFGGYDWTYNALESSAADMRCPVMGVDGDPDPEPEDPGEEEPVDENPPTITSDARDITPPEAPISFTFKASDDSGVSDISITTTAYLVAGGKNLVENSNGSEVTVDGATVNIEDSGGVGTVIVVDVTASDALGNSTTESFYINVLNPGKGL